MKLLLMAASLREDSLNQKLIRDAARRVEAQGAEADVAEFIAFDSPSYNGDRHDDTPPQVLAFRDRLQAADGLVLSSPEYNYSMPGSFKNLFDWMSTLKPMPWHRLNVLLMSATVSPSSGAQGMFSLRIPFDGCGAHVYPQNFLLRSAQDAFDDQGRLKEEALAARLDESLAGFQKFCRAMSADSGQ
jgi:NAD(P)H-dependent FMN reductase